MHTAKFSPWVADSEAPTAATGTVKVFAVCYISGTRRNKDNKRRRPELMAAGSTSPCAKHVAHGKDLKK